MKLTQDTTLAKKQDMSKNPFILSGKTLTPSLSFDDILLNSLVHNIYTTTF